MLTIIIAVIGFAADRIAKILTKLFVEPVGSVTVIDGIFSFTYVENRGAAHGILQGQRWPLIAVTCVVCALVIWFLVKNYGRTTKLLRVASGLILAGAFGNLFDRVFFGYVIDMMQVTFIEYPVFNPADNMLVVGVVLLGIYILFFDKEFLNKDKNKKEISESKQNTQTENYDADR